MMNTNKVYNSNQSQTSAATNKMVVKKRFLINLVQKTTRITIEGARDHPRRKKNSLVKNIISNNRLGENFLKIIIPDIPGLFKNGKLVCKKTDIRK